LRYLLVDRIVELERGQRAVGLKNVTLSEDFLADHFPERPIMPGVLIAEAMVQLADWVIRESTDFRKIGLVAGFARLKCRQFVEPGDQLRLDVEILSRTDAQANVRGKAFCENRLVAAADFTLDIQPIEQFLPRQEAARTYALLCCRDGNGSLNG
jgi:3-hydroxyacyl-[acyl-carrier-protein] dehydratase